MPSPALPYRLACLCDLRDERGRVLLLHRLKAPNKDLYSPIGGKLDMAIGESPAQCARREILEEAGIDVPIDRLHLMGLISEAGYEGSGHWLLFYYRVLGPVEVETGPMNEGRLEFADRNELLVSMTDEVGERSASSVLEKLAAIMREIRSLGDLAPPGATRREAEAIQQRLISKIDIQDVSSSFAMERIKYTTELPLTYAGGDD